MIRKIILFALFATLCIAANSQNGTIKGKLTEEVNGKNEPLAFANVFLEGTTIGTTSDFDGNFKFSAPVGEYNLKCSFLGYETFSKRINLTSGGEITVSIEMQPEGIAIEGVLIEAKMNRESEMALMVEQKEAILVKQSIGAQELSRKGISDAEGAVTKIAGISKQEGVKNVFVRGLGDRYNSTTLNGFPIPSEDPQFKNISLDFFTNDMIQMINVSKVFSASMNGDAGGALIDIRTKELNSNSEFGISFGSGFNTEVTNNNFVIMDGVSKTGYSNIKVPESTYLGEGEYQINNYSFSAKLDPVNKILPYKSELSVSYGSKFFDNNSFYLVGSISNDIKYFEGVSRQTTSTNVKVPFRDLTYKKYVQSAQHLLMGNLELNISNCKIQFNSLYIHTNYGYTSDYTGKDGESFQQAADYGYFGLTRRQQINDNSFYINQVSFERKISDRFKINLGSGLNIVSGKEPDRRVFKFASSGYDSLSLALGEGVNQRFNCKIDETAFVPKASMSYNFLSATKNKSSIEIGYEGRISIKDFEAPIFNHIWNTSYRPIISNDNVEISRFFNLQTYSNKSFVIDYYKDFYHVSRNSHGAYIDLVYHINEDLTLNAGMRADYVNVAIDFNVNKGSFIGNDTIGGMFILPSINLKYSLNDKHNLRLGASKTYTLPQDKEISPFIYQGEDAPETGNPNLIPSTNYNFDVKWDYYFSSNEMLSINGFYKIIKNPISRVDQGNSAGLLTFDNVSAKAIASGIEGEIRKKIFAINDKHTLNLGLNASYIYTKVELDQEIYLQNSSSSLEGAAPYLLNTDLTYNLKTDKISITSALVLNYISNKVYTIGTKGYNNIIEEAITTLDFVNSIKINKHFSVNLKAKNLLNPEYKLTRTAKDTDNSKGLVIRSYKKGISYNLGFSYTF